MDGLASDMYGKEATQAPVITRTAGLLPEHVTRKLRGKCRDIQLDPRPELDGAVVPPTNEAS